MTPFKRLSGRILERLRGVYHEGFEAPERLGEMVVAFANEYPHATRADWVRFASDHAAECYRSGYTRGYERVERDFENAMPNNRPEDIADELDPDWRWSPEIVLLGDGEAIVLERNDEEQLSAEEATQYTAWVIERNRRARA